MLFQGWSSAKGWSGGKPWPGHPYHPDNNIQEFNGILKNDIGPDLNDSRVRERQAAYIRKVVDTVNDLDNVLYEVTNEGGNKDWDCWVVWTVQEHEKTKPKQHPVGITGYGSESNDEMLASPADWVSLGSKDWPDLKTDPRAVDGRSTCWTPTTSSVSAATRVGLERLSPRSQRSLHGPLRRSDPQWAPVLAGQRVGVRDPAAPRRVMGQTRRIAERMNLAAMTPHPDLASSGYCLADPGKGYLIYLPEDGEITVDLSAAAGKFKVEWGHPIEGTVTRAEQTYRLWPASR